MDSNSQEISQVTTITTTTQSEKKRKNLCYHIVVLLISFIFFTFLFSLLAFFFILTADFVSILIDNFSIPTTTTTSSVSAQCKIVSTGVDLRLSKVCELGLLNYKVKYVFDPFEKTRFRCRYDYYWATIFKIEYREHSSGEIRSALVEAPKEALPLDCRPTFGTTWLTKDKFKVNETYNCKYTPGISDVDIFPDNLFNCQAKDPSKIDMIRKYSSLSMKIIGFWYTSKGSTNRAIRESAVSGMATSLTVLILVRVLQISKSRLARILDARNFHLSVYLKRACFLVVYFWCVGWLTIQYSKMLGLPDLFGSS
ncbi:hypothetical protein MKX01_026500 [Papaver californicum]|nr:hypothetical protein MKX01_026500 [Papaver californicum]